MVAVLFHIDLHLIIGYIILKHQVAQVIMLQKYVPDLVSQVVLGWQIHSVSVQFLKFVQGGSLRLELVKVNLSYADVIQFTDAVLTLVNLLAVHDIYFFLLKKGFLGSGLKCILFLVTFVPFGKNVIS